MLALEEQYLFLTIKYLTLILAVPSLCSIIGKAARFSGLCHAHSVPWLSSGFLYTGGSTGLARTTRTISSRQNKHSKENQLFNRDDF